MRLADERNSPIWYEGPLADQLFLVSVRGTEALGRLSEFKLEILSENPDIDPYRLLGQPAGVRLRIGEHVVRSFNGHVAHFGFAGSTGEYVRYDLILRPWLWLLTHSATCRIFQNQSVKDILEGLFRQSGFAFDISAVERGPAKEYVVQYRETDCDFAQRLMESEGIYYHFRDERARAFRRAYVRAA